MEKKEEVAEAVIALEKAIIEYRTAWREVIAPAWADVQRANLLAYKSHGQAMSQAWALFEEIIRAGGGEEEAYNKAYAALNEASTRAWAALEKAAGPSWAAMKEISAPIEDAFDLALARAEAVLDEDTIDEITGD